MKNTITESKAALRKEVRAVLKGMSPGHREKESEKARALLLEQRFWKEAQTVLFYAPLLDEVDVWPLARVGLETGKRVALPRFEPDANAYVACEIGDVEGDPKIGCFGIREPVEHCAEIRLNPLDLILVPGVAFDTNGRRLGRGRGFYDQILAAIQGITCGVAFDEQIVEAIPVAPHDVVLNCILTPTRWLEL